MSYFLSKDYTFKEVYFCGKFEGNWFAMAGSDFTIFRGYTWDGSSFVPNCDKTRIPSMLHDILYKEKNPLTRKCADMLFLREMKKNKFKFAYPYYFAVRAFGWIFYRG